MSITDPQQPTEDRLKTLTAVAHGLSPMHPRQWEEIAEEVETLHQLRHEEIGHPCLFQGDEPLDDGCYVRYRMHRQVQGLPPGWSFEEKRVR